MTYQSQLYNQVVKIRNNLKIDGLSSTVLRNSIQDLIQS